MNEVTEALDQIIALALDIQMDGSSVDTWDEAKAAAARIVEMARSLKSEGDPART